MFEKGLVGQKLFEVYHLKFVKGKYTGSLDQTVAGKRRQFVWWQVLFQWQKAILQFAVIVFVQSVKRR